MKIINFFRIAQDLDWNVELPTHIHTLPKESRNNGIIQLLNNMAQDQLCLQWMISSNNFETASHYLLRKSIEKDWNVAQYHFYPEDPCIDQIAMDDWLHHFLGQFPENLYLLPVSLTETKESARLAFFKCGKRNRLAMENLQYEWHLLSKTSRWRWWYALASWSDFANDEEIPWIFTNEKPLHFKSFQYLTTPYSNASMTQANPDEFISINRNQHLTNQIPFQLSILVYPQHEEIARHFFDQYFYLQNHGLKVTDLKTFQSSYSPPPNPNEWYEGWKNSFDCFLHDPMDPWM